MLGYAILFFFLCFNQISLAEVSSPLKSCEQSSTHSSLQSQVIDDEDNISFSISTAPNSFGPIGNMALDFTLPRIQKYLLNMDHQEFGLTQSEFEACEDFSDKCSKKISHKCNTENISKLDINNAWKFCPGIPSAFIPVDKREGVSAFKPFPSHVLIKNMKVSGFNINQKRFFCNDQRCQLDLSIGEFQIDFDFEIKAKIEIEEFIKIRNIRLKIQPSQNVFPKLILGGRFEYAKNLDRVIVFDPELSGFDFPPDSIKLRVSDPENDFENALSKSLFNGLTNGLSRLNKNSKSFHFFTMMLEDLIIPQIHKNIQTAINEVPIFQKPLSANIPLINFQELIDIQKIENVFYKQIKVFNKFIKKLDQVDDFVKLQKWAWLNPSFSTRTEKFLKLVKTLSTIEPLLVNQDSNPQFEGKNLIEIYANVLIHYRDKLSEKLDDLAYEFERELDKKIPVIVQRHELNRKTTPRRILNSYDRKLQTVEKNINKLKEIEKSLETSTQTKYLKTEIIGKCNGRINKNDPFNIGLEVLSRDSKHHIKGTAWKDIPKIHPAESDLVVQFSLNMINSYLEAMTKEDLFNICTTAQKNETCSSSERITSIALITLLWPFDKYGNQLVFRKAPRIEYSEVKKLFFIKYEFQQDFFVLHPEFMKIPGITSILRSFPKGKLWFKFKIENNLIQFEPQEIDNKFSIKELDILNILFMPVQITTLIIKNLIVYSFEKILTKMFETNFETGKYFTIEEIDGSNSTLYLKLKLIKK
ncbi:MAG: hypothetical protein H6622_15375 [Halobacteriovoraceae bacterium]|nr:hypothetical protein [Halobacteriovoraceae bacterium]